MNEEVKGRRKLYKFDVPDLATFKKNLKPKLNELDLATFKKNLKPKLNENEGGRFKKIGSKKFDELPVKKINIL